MSIQQNQIVQPTYNGQDIYYRTPVDAIITDGMSLDDYIRNTTGVVESGSNSNGSYIKLADGTLIQQGNTGTFSVPASQSGVKAVTFPINFYDTDYYVVQTELGGGAYWSWVNVSTQNKTISGFNCSCWNNTSASAANVGYSWIAIGRWKDYDASVLPDQQQSTIINSASTNYSNDAYWVGWSRSNASLSAGSSLWTNMTTSKSKNVTYSSNVLTVNKSGLYFFKAFTHWQGTSTGSRHFFEATISGGSPSTKTNIRSDDDEYQTGDPVVTCTELLYLQAGAKITMTVYTSAAATFMGAATNSVDASSVYIYKIGDYLDI